MKNIIERLKKLAYRPHYNCEDSWYSCPLSEDGCYNDAAGNECNCWARDNEKMEDLFKKLEEQISTKGKPVVWAIFTPRGFHSSSDDILIVEDMQRKLRQFDIDAIIKPLGFIEESKTNEA